MKTLDQVIEQYKSKCIDGRDILRLIEFMPEDRLQELKVELKEDYVGKHKAIEFTKENILKQLQEDVAFGFEKAINQRGLSAGMMYEVVSMWNWILEEGLENFKEYAPYGMPLFKATAEKYGFENKAV